MGADVFRVAGVFLTEVRDRYAVPEPPIGHAEGPIAFRVFGGGIEQVGDDTFRVVTYGGKGGGGAIVAYHPGDRAYRYAEQPAAVRIPRLSKGKPQRITFPAIGDVKAGVDPVPLEATSDSGLPVTYVVRHGPALIENGKLRICDIPARARLPLEVAVTAYQWGSAVEPFVQTAEPVTRKLMVHPSQ